MVQLKLNATGSRYTRFLDLHSNMVQLKLEIDTNLKQSTKGFTFQYGSIKTSR